MHPAAAGVGAECDPSGRRGRAAVRRRSRRGHPLLGQVVQRQRRILPLRAARFAPVPCLQCRRHFHQRKIIIIALSLLAFLLCLSELNRK